MLNFCPMPSIAAHLGTVAFRRSVPGLMTGGRRRVPGAGIEATSAFKRRDLPALGAGGTCRWNGGNMSIQASLHPSTWIVWHLVVRIGESVV